MLYPHIYPLCYWLAVMLFYSACSFEILIHYHPLICLQNAKCGNIIDAIQRGFIQHWYLSMAKNDDIRSRLLLSLMINHFETEWEIKIEPSLWHQNKKWSTDIPSEGCIRIVYNHWPLAPHAFLLVENSVNLTHFSGTRKNSKAWQR